MAKTFWDDLEKIMKKHFGEEWEYRFDEKETVLFHPELDGDGQFVGEGKPADSLPWE